MSSPSILAERLASPRRPAGAGAAAAQPRLESALHLLLLTLIATLAGRLELAHAAIAFPALRGTPSHPAPAAPHGRPCHRTPASRAARHGGPVPARRLRIGRIATWFASHHGATTLPGRLRAILSLPARAPPHAHPAPISHQKTPQPGCASARP
jgi:hypothetical protein